MKKLISTFFITLLLACNSDTKKNKTDNALNKSLKKAKQENAKAINLEATIKTIFVLDEAIKNVKDVNEFKEYLYKFDMNGVAPNVIDCYQKLIPILK